MALSDIKLTNYDNVVAVTQQSINNTMGVYLFQHPTSFQLYAKDDGEGNLTLTSTKEGATYGLAGNITLAKDEDGNYIKLVELHTDKNQTVRYNVTMENAAFSAYEWGIEYKQKETTPWVFQFLVNLSMEDVAKSALSDELKEQVMNVDENMFSIKQLYLDLNSAALGQVENVKAPDIFQGTIQNMIKLMVVQQQQQGKPIFGISVQFKDSTKKPLAPTFTPTYVDFCVTPYLDENGAATNSSLDTLNYLVMTRHNKAPAYPPRTFAFNWVEEQDAQNAAGVMAVRRDQFIPFFVESLESILPQMSRDIKVKSSISAKIFEDIKGSNEITLSYPQSDLDFEVVNSQDNTNDSKKIATYFYKSTHNHKATTRKQNPPWTKASCETWGTYSASCDVMILESPSLIKISGSISMSIKMTLDDGTFLHSTTENSATYPWSVTLELYTNTDTLKNGKLDFKIYKEDFDSYPTGESSTSGGFAEFLRDIEAMFGKKGSENALDIRPIIKDTIGKSVLTSLRELLKQQPNSFIFPGAKTFAYKQPQFSNNLDLACMITYLNPNA